MQAHSERILKIKISDVLKRILLVINSQDILAELYSTSITWTFLIKFVYDKRKLTANVY